MTIPNREALRTRLIKEEGLRLKPYTDTGGRLSIGVGRNLTDVGISQDEAMLLLDHDIEKTISLLTVRGAPWFTGLDQVRQQVCCDMAFNLGIAGFFGFTKMIRAIGNGDFVTAAQEMLSSQWAGQVGARADVLAAMMESGVE